MRISPDKDKLSLINRQNLHNRNYLRSLITESLRVNLISMQTVDDLQMQIMGQLEALLRESDPENAEHAASQVYANEILSGVFFTLDTYLLGFHDPMYAIAALQTGNIGEMYENGKKLLRTHFCETVSLWVRVRRCAPDVQNGAFYATINRELYDVLHAYDPLRPQLTFPPFSYTLASNMWTSHSGIFAVKYYLKYLLAENHFCNLFSPLKPTPGNLFSETANIALADALLGKYTGTVSLSAEEYVELETHLRRRTNIALREIFQRAARDMLDDLMTLTESERVYVKWYAHKLADAVAQAGEETEAIFPIST